MSLKYCSGCKKDKDSTGNMDERGLCGIDRINSCGDYTSNNVVSACKMCNYMKKVWTQESFVALCGHIATYKHVGYYDMIDDRLVERKSMLYSDYLYSAKRRKYTVAIDQETFDFITKFKCYLCGKKNSLIHQNGIDRIDNDKGYMLENCESCCKTCNFLKRDYELNTFLGKCVQIYDHCKDKVVFKKTKLEICSKNQ